MADQTSRGFRKFMLDPKSSVMTYIADNIPSEHLSHQQGSNGRLQHLQHGPMSSQQSNLQDPSRLQQNQILGQNPQNSHSSSPQPGFAQPVQSSQFPMNTPYMASNLSNAHQGLDSFASTQSQLPGSQSTSSLSAAQDSGSQHGPQSQVSSIQNGSQSTTTLGHGPPPPGTRRRNLPQSAPRLYHRMMLEFEITKTAFFLAKSQHNIQTMTSTAYELESSSRKIWGLRYEHSWEFEGYPEAGHQAVFSKWQAEYDMWADTVLDIQDGQILGGTTEPAKYGNASMHNNSEEWNSSSRHDQSGYQNGEIQHHSQSMQPEEMPPNMAQHLPPNQPIPPQQQISPPHQTPQQLQFSPSQNIPQLQNLTMGQFVPPSQSTQNSQLSQLMPPGPFSQNAPPPNTNGQSVPPQQHQQSPQPSQIPVVQTPPSTMQNGQSPWHSQLNGSPNMQNIPSPNMQPPQNMRPGQAPELQQSQNRPPQQYMQPNQGLPSGSAPNVHQQQTFGAGQQGPPRSSMSPGQNVSQGPNQGPRQNPSPRPGSQMPPSVQGGGQRQDNRRQ